MPQRQVLHVSVRYSGRAPGVTGQTAVTTGRRGRVSARLAELSSASWPAAYLRQACLADGLCGLLAGVLAYVIRFGTAADRPAAYLGISLLLPACWLLTILMAGGYDSRFIGVGTDEFRKILNAGVFLTAAVAVASYATKADIARGYVVVALPCLTAFDLVARFALRKRLHRLRETGACMRTVVVVGYAAAVADIATMLRREPYHGLPVTPAGMCDGDEATVISDIPAFGGINKIVEVVRGCQADTVAVLAWPEKSWYPLRKLGLELAKNPTELCVAPALLDVAGPRTTNRPAGRASPLPLGHSGINGAPPVLQGPLVQ